MLRESRAKHKRHLGAKISNKERTAVEFVAALLVTTPSAEQLHASVRDGYSQYSSRDHYISVEKDLAGFESTSQVKHL